MKFILLVLASIIFSANAQTKYFAWYYDQNTTTYPWQNGVPAQFIVDLGYTVTQYNTMKTNAFNWMQSQFGLSTADIVNFPFTPGNGGAIWTKSPGGQYANLLPTIFKTPVCLAGIQGITTYPISCNYILELVEFSIYIIPTAGFGIF